MSLMKKSKKSVKKRVKKIIIHAIRPFIPFILIFVGLLFAFCSIIDAIFIQDVQSDNTSMSVEEVKLKNQCIERAEVLNTCNNFVDNQSTKYLLDVNNREMDKVIEWSHLHAIMAFHNMTYNRKIDENLLDEVSDNFISTFRYEKDTIKTETTLKDDNGNETTTTKEETQFILVESDTIIGHYKYNYEEKTTQKDNVKITKKVFVNEQLLGDRYERLKEYLKEKLHVRNSDIDYDVQVIIQAANGYSEGQENISWLQENVSSDNIITDGKGLIPTRYVYMANSWIYKNNISFRYENTSYNWSIQIT